VVAGAGAKKAFDLMGNFLKGSKYEDVFPKCGKCNGSLVPVKVKDDKGGLKISWGCTGCEIIIGPEGVKEGRKENRWDRATNIFISVQSTIANAILTAFVLMVAGFLIIVIFDKVLEIFGLNLIPSI